MNRVASLFDSLSYISTTHSSISECVWEHAVKNSMCHSLRMLIFHCPKEINNENINRERKSRLKSLRKISRTRGKKVKLYGTCKNTNVQTHYLTMCEKNAIYSHRERRLLVFSFHRDVYVNVYRKYVCFSRSPIDFDCL